MKKWTLLAYHREDLRVPLVVRVPQVGNPWSRALILIFFTTALMSIVTSFESPPSGLTSIKQFRDNLYHFEKLAYARRVVSRIIFGFHVLRSETQ